MPVAPLTHPALYRDLADLPDKWRGNVLAIGNFDGVHLGHHAVIANARAHADKLGCPLGVILFDPHPRRFFAPDAPSFRLTRIVTRARLLEAAGVDFTLALPFDARMASCEAEDFITDFWSGTCKPNPSPLAMTSALAKAGAAISPCCRRLARRMVLTW